MIKKRFGIVMKNAILYNTITGEQQIGTQSSTIKKKHRFRGAKNKKINMNKTYY